MKSAQCKKAEETRKYFNIVLVKNSLSPSSSMSFRTQSHWSYFTRQCINSKRFLRVHLSRLDMQLIHIPSQIQDWLREDNIWTKDRQYLSRLWILWQRTQRSWDSRYENITSCIFTSKKSKRHQDTMYGVDIKLIQQEGFLVRSNKIKLNHPFRHTSSLLYLESYYDKIWRNHKRESACVFSKSSKNFF